jgi:iron complex transport system permease protein
MADRQRRSIPFVYKLALGTVSMLAMFFLAMVFGAADTTLRETWQAITWSGKTDTLTIIREIRMPREIAAVFVGAALAVSGAIMQGMTRNPLADPGLLGLTSGANAALAVTIAFVPAAGYFGITLACFVGAAVGSLIVFGIGAAKRGGLSPLRLVLAGAAVSTFLYAIAEGVSLYFQISKDVTMWTAGGLIGVTWEQLGYIIPFIGVGIAAALLLSRQLSIMSLSEEAAAGLGQRTGLIRSVLFLVNVVLAGASVALVGNLVFIGLMVPHIVRAIAGTDYRKVLPLSVTTGATVMLAADTLARTVNAPFETPVAAIIAVLGLPFFLMIIRRGGQSFT